MTKYMSMWINLKVIFHWRKHKKKNEVQQANTVQLPSPSSIPNFRKASRKSYCTIELENYHGCL